MRRVFVIAAVAAASCLVGNALGCQSTPADLREWRASDHSREANEPAEDPALGTSDDGDPMIAARATYNAQCRGCHGPSGRGDGPQAMMAHPPDWTSPAFQASRTDEGLALVIRNGRGAMPAFGQQLRPEGVALLVRLVREFGRAPR